MKKENIMTDYTSMLTLAQAHGYSSFTELQQRAFEAPETHNEERDLFVMGETSSGKTLIPLLLYAAAVEDAEHSGMARPKLLFVVPYRALAAQKTKEIRRFFRDKNMTITQSTGEFRQDDAAIQAGNVDVAVVICEKVYRYAAKDSAFLSLYDYLVLDEIGLLNNPDRGIRLDFIIAWAKNQRNLLGRPRTVALATPFFDWSAYIKNYDFLEIRSNGRPVQLNTTTAIYSPNGILEIVGKSDFLHTSRIVSQQQYDNLLRKFDTPEFSCIATGGKCAALTPCRHDLTLTCPVTGKQCSSPIEIVTERNPNVFKYMLLKICREHLQKGHQILIFINNREDVRSYCRYLYRQLADLLPPTPPAEVCKAQILSTCGLEGEDVFGILEEGSSDVDLEFYRAFASGVGFHSAALPNELRTYVEDKLLNSQKKEMRIVCSTETLAFGVNSSVDVVVVANLQKQEGMEVRPLTLNEHRNYVGRSGRLRRDTDAADITGYVYNLVHQKQRAIWEEMLAGAETTERLYSLFHTDTDRRMPFFLLNLLPTDSEHGVSVSELASIVCQLPQDGSFTPDLIVGKVRQAMRYLEKHGLACAVRTSSFGRGAQTPTEVLYRPTALGVRLRGYIIGSEDYETLLAAIEEFLGGVFLDFDKTTFLYRILQTNHATTGLNSIFSASETRCDINETREYIRNVTASPNARLEWLDECRNERTLFVLAALLAWSEGESAKMLYRKFGVHYALLSRLAEQLAYLLEITREVLPARMEKIWAERRKFYAKLSVAAEDDFLCEVDNKIQTTNQLIVSIQYGINMDVASDLLRYLNEKAALGNSAAAEKAEELALEHIHPGSARTHRRIGIRYNFFRNPPVIDESQAEARNNLRSQYIQYQKDVYNMGPLITDFFRTTLGQAFELYSH